MAVCRVEKNKNYTTMSNFHLRDPNLSNKARGLLSTMLSLPEDWDYTTRGLAKICKDGVDGITAQLKELEQYRVSNQVLINLQENIFIYRNSIGMNSTIKEKLFSVFTANNGCRFFDFRYKCRHGNG